MVGKGRETQRERKGGKMDDMEEGRVKERKGEESGKYE